MNKLTYKRNPKGYNNDKIRKYGVLIAQSEITKQIGPLGIESCLAIGAIAESLVPHYRDYLALVENCQMNVEWAAEYFAPTVFETLSANQRDVLASTMRQEHYGTITEIRRHLGFLEALVNQIKDLGPNGQLELFKQRRKLQGFTEQEIEKELAEQEAGKVYQLGHDEGAAAYGHAS